MRAKFKPWAIPYMEEHRDVAVTEINEEFIKAKPCYLEIGPGKGDFMVGMASKFPQYNFMAIEINSSVAGITTKKLVEAELKNVNLLWSDVGNVFEMMKDKTFEGIFLNHSDPWPKKRHEKRRLTYKDKLVEYYRILKDDGKLYFKTDNYEFYLYTKKSLENSEFKIIFDSDDYQLDETFDCMTEYERNWRAKGVKINRIICSK